MSSGLFDFAALKVVKFSVAGGLVSKDDERVGRLNEAGRGGHILFGGLRLKDAEEHLDGGHGGLQEQPAPFAIGIGTCLGLRTRIGTSLRFLASELGATTFLGVCRRGEDRRERGLHLRLGFGLFANARLLRDNRRG